ncbi:hypothetical protein P7K49_014906 [Saguinus oedipus]|uniref:Uncharacterized protein n=1 Tax=Saguinus oedipus TaxID=9490 RepID=A0ABQ9V7P7_SAGOE|nr:hypothetical protein P7K49_014906 [Saguinus oedipus]
MIFFTDKERQRPRRPDLHLRLPQGAGAHHSPGQLGLAPAPVTHPATPSRPCRHAETSRAAQTSGFLPAPTQSPEPSCGSPVPERPPDTDNHQPPSAQTLTAVRGAHRPLARPPGHAANRPRQRQSAPHRPANRRSYAPEVTISPGRRAVTPPPWPVASADE